MLYSAERPFKASPTDSENLPQKASKASECLKMDSSTDMLSLLRMARIRSLSLTKMGQSMVSGEPTIEKTVKER